MSDYILYHHGIKGMHWGVRRYQNKDGTRTPAGKSRLRSLAKGVAIGGAVAGTAALAYYGAKSGRRYVSLNNDSLTTHFENKFLELSKKSITAIADAAKKNAPVAKDMVTKAGGKMVKGLSSSASRVGQAMCDAAMVSIGGIAIAKLTDKLAPSAGADQRTKDRNKVILDVASAGIKEATKGSSKVNNRSTNELLNKTRDLKNSVGEPKGMFGAEDEKAYQALFKRQPTDDQRALIKAMRKNNYSPDQIEKYVFHSGLDPFDIACSVVTFSNDLNDFYSEE